MSSPEANIVASLKDHLGRSGLGGARVGRILVDADPSYLRSSVAHRLEPMARVPIGDARPDLVCGVARGAGPMLAAFEVKASSADWIRGIGQALQYRPGVHYAYLALPSPQGALTSRIIESARKAEVGLMFCREHAWDETLPPPEPTPVPWQAASTTLLLEGVPAARQLQLNHPLNYLVVAYLSAGMADGSTLLTELESGWPDLGSEGTRRHAIVGAETLGLVDREGRVTMEGFAVADLMRSLGFQPANRPDKRTRLAEASPALAAVARLVLFRQPLVQLLCRALTTAAGPLSVEDLARRAERLDPILSSALFLADPTTGFEDNLPPEAYRPSAMFKLKQNLWHAGILRHKAHSSAGGRAADYRPGEDLWELENLHGRGLTLR